MRPRTTPSRLRMRLRMRARIDKLAPALKLTRSNFNLCIIIYVQRILAIYAMAAGGGGRIKNVVSDAEFQMELIAAGEQLVVVDFFATW